MIKSTLAKLVRILSALAPNDSASVLSSFLSKHRLLRIEPLENRELLSADGLLSACVATFDASFEASALFSESTATESSDSTISIEGATGTPSSYALLAPPPEQVLRNEASYIEALSDSELFWEGETLDSLDESIIETSFVDDQAEYFDDSHLDVRQVVFADDALSNALGGGTNLQGSDGSGGSGGLPSYDLTITTTLASSLSASSGGAVNPVLERRGVDAAGTLNNADYVVVTFPAMPNEYYARVTFSGASGNCAVYSASQIGGISGGGGSGGLSGSGGFGSGGFDWFEYSGGAVTYYFVPINNSLLQNNRSITATITPICLSGGGTGSGGSGGSGNLSPGNFQQYEFTNTGAQTIMTIIDDDQWQVRAVVDADGGVAWEAGVGNSCARRDGSFKIVKSPNSSVANLASLYSGYSLDETYDMTFTLLEEGTATYGTDFLYTNSAGYSVGYATIPAYETNVTVFVAPQTETGVNGTLFENDETVIPKIENYGGTYVVQPTQGQINILQAPEFKTLDDSLSILVNGTAIGASIVNRDEVDFGFIYGKPEAGDILGSPLSCINNRSCHLEISNQFFTIDDDDILAWKDNFPSPDTYEFTIVVKVVDDEYPGLYDEYFCHVTYGWATFSILCRQPNPGSRMLMILSYSQEEGLHVEVGHTSWSLEATPSLIDYCEEYYSTTQALQSVVGNTYNGSIEHLQLYANHAYGFYPSPGVNISNMYDEIGYMFGLEGSLEIGGANVYATYYIGQEHYVRSLAYAYHLTHSSTEYYRPSKNQTTGEPSRNCADVALEATGVAGLNITTILRIEMDGENVIFEAHTPADLGEDLVDPQQQNNGVRGQFTLGASINW